MLLGFPHVALKRKIIGIPQPVQMHFMPDSGHSLTSIYIYEAGTSTRRVVLYRDKNTGMKSIHVGKGRNSAIVDEFTLAWVVATPFVQYDAICGLSSS